MKVVAYATRPDEQYGFDKFTKELNIEVKYITQKLCKETAHEAEGFEFVTILGNCDASSEVLEILSGYGVKYIASRSAGYNNIDLKKAKELGIRVSNANYSPYCVSDFTVMLILMSIRKVSRALQRGQVQDFSLVGIQGKEMHNLTVGVVGTGRIGQAVIKSLTGFGCKIVAYDLYPNEAMKQYVEYVSLEELYKTSDVITLHTPLFESNYHLINKETIDQMKDGVVIINTARGELVNTGDLIEKLEEGKIGAAGLDVLENEMGIFHHDCRHTRLNNRELQILSQMPNVILTQHYAFYTDQAVCDMVECGLRSLKAFKDGVNNPYEL